MAWVPPMVDWVKLNIDGSRNIQLGSLTVGEVVRNHNSQWLRGFAMHRGSESILEAQLWAVFEGLNMVWDAEYKQVQVESDWLEAVSLIQNGCNDDNPLWFLIQSCSNLMNKAWRCQMSHIFRKCNSLANNMADLGHSCKYQTCYFEVPPPLVVQFVVKDFEGLIHARHISSVE
ncbi:hypothetical protein ACOSP7_026860 [Xanthoceras sorbifolium]